eukprot:CAMPEP_0114513818 /NCGR_PEP_ID=MMETSP0109-20121206/15799_1 /TAXON_ID=29199 /ORGANISM="Chlorarachnion reptans, Strain CCCM449" /LENGTH=54 /DNA_ID=CAMNT_0001693769 /DNA_START=510 /DNA_END=674 /DNA_ORIENTATION=-
MTDQRVARESRAHHDDEQQPVAVSDAISGEDAMMIHRLHAKTAHPAMFRSYRAK